MECWLWKKAWLIVIILVRVFGSGSGCFPEEKASLLEFKAAYSISDSLLPSWVDHPNTNCCHWERVTCDSAHVTILSLHTLTNTDPDGSCLDYANFNLSFFVSFKELTTLNLSQNCFDAFISNGGGDNRNNATLKRLETLDLSHNKFNESIMKFLSSLTALRNLNLADNEIGGIFPSQEMSLLRNLEVLDLQLNYDLGGPLTSHALANLSKLKDLKLNDLSLNGSFPNQGFCKMKQLEVLDLSGNYMEGVLDTCLSNLTSLRTLDLSFNSLSGIIPPPLIASLSSLEYLSFDSNKFEGLLSLNIFSNHSNLKTLRLGYMNSQTFQLQTENPPWVPSFQLQDLQIAYSNINLPTKTIPNFLSSQNALTSIDLSGNDLVGSFPNWLILNNTKLEYVDLGENSFTGTFQLPFDPNHHTHMDQTLFLSISNNKIQGELPQNLGFFFPNLQDLYTSSNMFQGQIPASIGEMSSLIVLDLQNNSFSGEVPGRIFTGCTSLTKLMMDNNQLNGTLSTSIEKTKLFWLTASRNNFEGPITKEIVKPGLRVLDLSYNGFSGALPSTFKMESIVVIRLQGNSLTGVVPDALFVNSSKSLLAVDLSDNSFTGTIPESIYGLEQLTFLLLAGNKFEGQIPHQICQLRYIHILDLSYNNFSGSIPYCISNISFSASPAYYNYMASIEGLQLITKGLSLVYKGHILDNMSSLDLSCNQLTGEIPYQTGDLYGLHALNLSYNHLNGSIPESFSRLKNIESMDLSNNRLSGPIPLQLQDLHSISFFNVSYNNLSGRVPDKGQFGTFDESSYRGNPYLSYDNSNRGIAIPPPPPPMELDEGKKDDSAIDFTSFCWSFFASYGTVVMVLATILWINPYWRRSWFFCVQRCLLKCFGQFLEDALY